MNNHHLVTALASERHNALLAEAEASRLARQARLYRRRTAITAARRWPLRWLFELVAVRPKPPAMTPVQPYLSGSQPIGDGASIG